MLTSTVCSVGLAVFFVGGLRLGLAGVFLAQLIGVSAGLAIGLLLARYPEKRAYSRAKLREMLAFSVPLVPSSVAVILMLSIDRLLINSLLTLEDVGIYGVGYRLSVAAALLMVGFQLAFTPLIYARFRDPSTPAELARIFRLFCSAALAGVLGLSLFADHLVQALATERYFRAAPLLPILGAAVLLSGMYLFAPGLAIAKRTRVTALINIAGAILNTILCVLLIPAFGILGAGLSTLIASAMLFAGNMVLSQQNYPVPHNWLRIGAGLGVCMGIGALGLVTQLPGVGGLLLRLVLVVVASGALIWLRLVEPSEVRAAARLATRGRLG
jgi:O-antigen/teichoic acid export membrane protein